MALEFTKRGQISLENREAHFKNDSPTNPEKWDSLKKMLFNSFGKPTAISFSMINETFNPIKDTWSGMTLRTSREQFMNFCWDNYIQCIEDHNSGVYIVRTGLPKY